MNIDNLKYLHELEQFLQAHGVSQNEIVLRGSACLAVRNIRPQGDLDIFCTTETRTKLPTNPPKKIEISTDKYENIGLSAEELIYDDRFFDTVDEWKILRPEIYLSKKRLKTRRKDRMDALYLEQYAIQNPDDWDWDLVRLGSKEEGNWRGKIYSFIDKTRDEGLWEGVVEAKNELLELLGFESPFTPYADYRSGKALVESSQVYLGIDELLSNCYTNGEFQRRDLLYKTLLIKSVVLDEGPELESEVPDLDEIQGFYRDINLYKEWTGYYAGKPVILNYQNKIVHDGGLVRKLIEGKYFAPVAYQREELHRPETESLSNALKSQLDPFADELLESLKWKYGLLFYVIVWPAAVDDFDLVQEKVAEEYDIVSSSKIYESDINDFARKLYSSHLRRIDTRVVKKANKLVEENTDSDPNLGVLVIDVPQRDSNLNPEAQLDILKREIRNYFKHELEYSETQSILHTSDDWRENRELNDWLLEKIEAPHEELETAN